MEKDHSQKNAIRKFKLKKNRRLSAQEYFEGIRAGNITLLSQAITLVESSNRKHHELAQQIIDLCIPYSGNSIRVGITGVPGVGKSTFIEAMGEYITSIDQKLAVLAIDPSSQVSKGSILGDKTRMEKLSGNHNAFIRPSPSAGALGGVANATRESILLCEAAGYNVIFVETVGVGQSETAVHSMVDFFLLLMLSGAGDELQGIKRGIMEMADTIIINKADGDNLKKAKLAKREYLNALHLFPPSPTGWFPKVETCSALKFEGMDKVWKILQEYKNAMTIKGFFEAKRQEQSKYWMHEAIREELDNLFKENEAVKGQLSELESSVTDGRLNSYTAAKKLIDIYLKSLK